MHKTQTKKDFPIVGIGASAGGLEAFTELLKQLPVNTSIGFVLIQHLDPTHPSVLTDILSRTTKIPVAEIKDLMAVEPNHIYVIPPNVNMTITKGILKLTSRNKNDRLHMPIDHFLHSLAQDQKHNAIGVILSGTASDGMLGLKAIKTEGGITFAQDETAKYQGMPQAAIVSGYVDFILPPSGIAKELLRISQHTNIHPPKVHEAQKALAEVGNELKRILFLLHKNTGVDFRHYKEATIKRRISRRMHLHKLSRLGDYVNYLKENSGESEALCQDILINVTSFFRDPPTFQFLKDTVFPRLLKNRSLKEPIRIWVPGCATGEEVYSLTISLSEFLEEAAINIPVQVFGTDLDKIAIEKARKGNYPKNDLVELTSKRLERFFVKTDGNYQIVKPIRDQCVFAPHNVFNDPPFSRLDLISCCNLLIYLDSVLQDKIFRTFHYALRQEGFLMLGKSESPGTSSELYSQLNKKYKIYARKAIVVRRAGNFAMNNIKGESDTPFVKKDVADGFDPHKEADTILLTHYIPASVVINSDLEIMQFRGSTGTYLEHSMGKANLNLIKMAKEGLGFELRNVISKTKKSGEPVKKEGIQVKQNGTIKEITIEVLPLNAHEEESYYLVLFEDTRKSVISQLEVVTDEAKSDRLKRGAKDRRIAELEQELAQTREDMRSVTEEQEAVNEELQSASEEILSSNEELQSLNEELETSKEELESTNEELITVNEELQNRNEQLTEARDYAHAIIRTVQIPLLILGHDLQIKTTNRSFCQTFHVTEEETEGSLLYDLGGGQWNIPSLRKLLGTILPQNSSFDNFEVNHTFPSIGHKIMLLNARKFYKDGENILLAIEDITERKQMQEEQVKIENERLIQKQQTAFIAVASHELKTPITSIKAHAQMLERMFKKNGNEDAAQQLTKMITQLNLLTSLVGDLLDIAKIEGGQLRYHKELFDLDKLVCEKIEEFQRTTQKHSLIHEGHINTKIYGDCERISQVLSNLLSNAIKYSPKGGKIITKLSYDKINCYIAVQDYGIGIAKNKQQSIFKRFYRIQHSGEFQGLGVGLYISNEIIKRHGGELTVKSQPGKGSVFVFSLPLKKK